MKERAINLAWRNGLTLRTTGFHVGAFAVHRIPAMERDTSDDDVHVWRITHRKTGLCIRSLSDGFTFSEASDVAFNLGGIDWNMDETGGDDYEESVRLGLRFVFEAVIAEVLDGDVFPFQAHYEQPRRKKSA